MTQELIQLPNKDLWRGRSNDAPVTESIIEVPSPDANLSPMDKALAAIVASAKGSSVLSCLWCGQQGDRTWVKEHLVKNHGSVIEPSNAAQVALAELSVAQAVVKE